MGDVRVLPKAEAELSTRLLVTRMQAGVQQIEIRFLLSVFDERLLDLIISGAQRFCPDYC